MWALLLVGAAAVLGICGRSVWRKAKKLAAEVTHAGDRLAIIPSLGPSEAYDRDQ